MPNIELRSATASRAAIKKVMIKRLNKRSIFFVLLISCFLSGCVAKPENGYLHVQIIPKSTEFMLTFDDGPLPNKTELVLDMLANLEAIDGEPVRAGFFLLADSSEEFWQRRVTYAPYEIWTHKGSIAKYPEIARRIIQEGHTIGNHTAHHPWFRWPWQDTPEAVQAEFTEWEEISKQVLGKSSTRLFRPPYSILTASVRITANLLSYQVVLGESVGDAIPNVSVEAVMKNTESILNEWNKSYPCVLIFHDNRPATYEHLTEIVNNLQQQGFRLVHFEPERL